jgi:hypothetical protein
MAGSTAISASKHLQIGPVTTKERYLHFYNACGYSRHHWKPEIETKFGTLFGPSHLVSK